MSRRPAPPPTSREPRPETVWRAPLLTWVAVIVLLFVNLALAYAPLGPAKTFVNLGLSVLQVALLGLFFMRLSTASPLVRLTALAGGVFLVFMFIMAGSDYFMRR